MYFIQEPLFNILKKPGRRVYACILLMANLFFPAFYAFSENFQTQSFSTLNGLPSNTVYAMLQDRHGDIWFATEYGVSRYNGFRFENFNLEHGMSDNDVFKLFQDSKGRIWLFMSNGRVNYILNNKIHNPENTKFLRNLKCRSYFNGMLEEPDGSIWFTTKRDGVFRFFPDGRITRLKPIADIGGNLISPGIWRDGKGQIRICTENGIVNLSKNPGLVETGIPQTSDKVSFTKMLQDGRVLVCLENKILVCRPPSEGFSILGQKEGFSDFIVSGITENFGGNLWISGINGLHLFRNGRLSIENHQVFFNGKTISGFIFDRQDNLWISTLNEGVLLVRDKESQIFGQKHGLPDVPLTSLDFFNGSLYFGNDRGGTGFIRNNRAINLKMPGKLFPYGRGRIREFKADPFHKTNIWAVSENGLLLSDGKSIRSYFPMDSKTIEFEGNNILIGSSYRCKVLNYDLCGKTGSFVIREYGKTPIDSVKIVKRLSDIWPNFQYLLPDTRVYKLLKDSSGTIWMATHSGIFSLQFGKIVYLREKNKDLGYPFQSMCLLSNGTIAAGSNGRGIILIRQDGKTEWISRKNGLISNYIRTLKSQGKDSLWACTPAGLSLISTRFGGSCYKIRNWTSTQSGLVSNDVFDVAVHRDSLWLAIGNKIQCIPSFRIEKNYGIPRVEAEYIKINRTERKEVKEIIAPDQGNNFILIRLRNPDHRNTGKTEFQYRIIPDTLWKKVNENEIREVLKHPGLFNVELRRLANGIMEKEYPLISIKIEKNPGVLSNLDSIDWFLRIPAFALLTLFLLALYLEPFAPPKK